MDLNQLYERNGNVGRLFGMDCLSVDCRVISSAAENETPPHAAVVAA